MSYATDHCFDDEECGLGQWVSEIEPDGPHYRCSDCGAVGAALLTSWYGYGPPVADEPEPPEVSCAECRRPLDDTHQVAGYGCGDCGHAVCEPGTDYCVKCNAAHDATLAADPLHHHVWQSHDDWQRTVREITLAQAGAR